MDLLDKAKEFAIKAHVNQNYGKRSYAYHLSKVEEVLRQFGWNPLNENDLNVLCAAWLHDTLEDTLTNYNDIKTAFGVDIAELVYAVTDELGRNRQERHLKSHIKLIELPLALSLKLADRIANIEECISTNDPKYKMYVKEHKQFKERLYNLIGDGRQFKLWNHLDELLNV